MSVLNTESTKGTNFMEREIRCSNDCWTTAIGSTGTYGWMEEGAELELFYARRSPMMSKADVVFEARDSTSAPELP